MPQSSSVGLSFNISLMVSLMNKIESKLSQLKDKLESTAFLVSKTGSEKQIHSEIVQSLVIVSEISQLLETGNNSQHEKKYSTEEDREVKKVINRLRLWANPSRQGQINSRILNSFLKLERSGISVITESALRNDLFDVSTFESNFTQMKVIAEKNHGKIFDQYGDKVILWEPIIPYIREYEELVFHREGRK